LQNFFEKPKRKVIEKEVEKEIDISKYLIEQLNIKDDDMMTTISFINNPRFGSFRLKSYGNNDENMVDVHISNGRRTITFEYNKDFDEFTMFLIDYCDEQGLTFKQGSERNINTAWVAVYK
jgi:hypothetical protein